MCVATVQDSAKKALANAKLQRVLDPAHIEVRIRLCEIHTSTVSTLWFFVCDNPNEFVAGDEEATGYQETETY